MGLNGLTRLGIILGSIGVVRTGHIENLPTLMDLSHVDFTGKTAAAWR